jgi:hypothetical protein
MDNVSLRTPREEDWPALTALGNLAISEMKIPPSQEPWAENRRSFPSDGIQRHFVAISAGRIVGYAGAEWRQGAGSGMVSSLRRRSPTRSRDLREMAVWKDSGNVDEHLCNSCMDDGVRSRHWRSRTYGASRIQVFSVADHR